MPFSSFPLTILNIVLLNSGQSLILSLECLDLENKAISNPIPKSLIIWILRSYSSYHNKSSSPYLFSLCFSIDSINRMLFDIELNSLLWWPISKYPLRIISAKYIMNKIHFWISNFWRVSYLCLCMRVYLQAHANR